MALAVLVLAWVVAEPRVGREGGGDDDDRHTWILHPRVVVVQEILPCRSDEGDGCAAAGEHDGDDAATVPHSSFVRRQPPLAMT